MTDKEKWQWQEPGTAWKGAALYHITMTVTDRQPVLGALITPYDDPAKTFVQRTALGDALVDCLMSIPRHHPEVKVLHFCLMPDHLHAVLYVQRSMPKGIGTVARGFWQAAKKLGRASSVPSSAPSSPSSSAPLIYWRSKKRLLQLRLWRYSFTFPLARTTSGGAWPPPLNEASVRSIRLYSLRLPPKDFM
jgi:REP element-mobilizing transposase RayT